MASGTGRSSSTPVAAAFVEPFAAGTQHSRIRCSGSGALGCMRGCPTVKRIGQAASNLQAAQSFKGACCQKIALGLATTPPPRVV